MLLSLQIALAALRLTDTTDAELLELYQTTQGERYFAELYRRYGPKVYARCRTLLGDGDEAHDAVQEVFERVLRKIGTFRAEAAFGTWLYRIASNHCLDRLRKRKRRRERPTETEALEPLAERARAEEADEARDWLAQQTPAAIKYILGQLSESDRTALLLMYMEELSVEEISAALDLKTSATKMRLKRARDRAHGHYQTYRKRLNAEA